ncbi:hypothetical protein BRD09_01505 [Halobacteriales archaeon SW_10_68_16]|jgi:hypothetical protein|nr:MAG: hypothetical protein BRD09_01505 [Halobacteriales archaeon SW_10_68_16]
MRRDHFTLTVDDAGEEAPPSLVLSYDGPAGELTERLTAEGSVPEGEDVDPAFRLQESADADDARGVFSLTRRLTGEYLLEAVAEVSAVRSLVDAARAWGDTYRIRIERPDAEAVVLESGTLLVYDADGNLRRTDSLIPSGVEL